MNVDINKLQECFDYMRQINSVDISELTWDGKSSEEVAINVAPEDWGFVGLSNVYFAELNDLVFRDSLALKDEG